MGSVLDELAPITNEIAASPIKIVAIALMIAQIALMSELKALMIRAIALIITPSFGEIIFTLAEGVTKRVPAERFFKPILSTVHKTSLFEQVWFLF